MLDGVGLDALVPDDEGDGFVDVDAQFDRRRVVRKNGHANVFLHLLDSLNSGFYKTFIEIVYCFEFQVYITIMPSFVCSLNMDENEVVGLQRLNGRAGLGLVVGVPQAGGAGHVDDPQAGIGADAADEVHGSDDAAAAYLG